MINDLYKLCFQNYCASLIYVVIKIEQLKLRRSLPGVKGGGQIQPSEQPSPQHLTVTLKCNIFYLILVKSIRQTKQTHLENVHKNIINILPISFLKLRGAGAENNHKQSDPWSTRQQRHLSYISEHSTDIRHIAGKHNITADYLSRSPISDTCNQVSMGLDLQALAAAQSTCQDTQCYRTAITGMTVADVPVHEGGPSLLCDTSSSKPRPIVPPGYRRHVFDLLHGLSHPSSRASKQLICSRYVWHGMKKDITHWCNECSSCQASKIQRHYRAPVEAIPVPPRRFTHVQVDIVGPFPTSRGYTYLLTILDRTTRWPEAVPLQDITAASCARAFMTGWVARFGVPLQMTFDRGRQFISSLWSEMARSLGTQLHRTTSYHPQANGMVERFHRSLKASLRARLHDGNWIDELPWVLLGLRTATKEDLQTSPAEMVFGDSPLLSGEFASSGKTPFFPSFTQTSTTSPQHHRVDTPTPLATLARSKYVFVRVVPNIYHCRDPIKAPSK